VQRDPLEIATLVLGYSWLLLLPWKVAIGSVFVGGFLVGIVVTASHQSEEIFEGWVKKKRAVQCSSRV
jgi:hypothetical protein